MRTYNCPHCRCSFSEADKSWDIATESVQCPKCLEPLRNFPVRSKQHEKLPLAQQPPRAAIQQPYPWGSVLTWVLFAFLLGLTTARPTWESATSIDRAALGVVVGIGYAVFTALIVGVLKFFKRTPGRLFFGAFGLSGDAQSADKTIFSFAIVLAILFAAMALFFQRYGLLVDAGVCGLLGAGVKQGSAPSRWLLAVYAFISPILVIFLKDSPGGAGAIWPFFFFAVCGSILAHQRESRRDILNVGNTVHATTVSSIDTTPKKTGQRADEPKPAVSMESAWDRQFSAASTETSVQATPSGASKAMSSPQPTANPIAPISIPVEPSQNTTEAYEDRLYEQIAQEMETNTVDKGLWTKAYAQAGGDDQQTRVLYIKARFARLLAMEDARRGAIRREQEEAARLAHVHSVRSNLQSRIEKAEAAGSSIELKNLAAGHAGSNFLYHCGLGKLFLGDVKRILEENPFVLERTTVDAGYTGLHLAVRSTDKEMIEYLVEQGANIQALDSQGKTPLDIARETNQPEIVELLEWYTA